jgi:hypothetical protein
MKMAIELLKDLDTKFGIICLLLIGLLFVQCVTCAHVIML